MLAKGYPAAFPAMAAGQRITHGEAVLRGLSGVFVDFTAICEIDNDTDRLRYRGYDLPDLIAHCDFEDIVYLLLFGELPDAGQHANLAQALRVNRQLPDGVHDLIRALPVGADPMAVLRTTVSALGCHEPHGAELDDIRAGAIRLIAQIPMLLGAFEALRRDQPPPEPMPDSSHAAHVLQQLTSRLPEPADAAVMDKVLIIHAEHELNASCFAARVTASTLSTLTAALTAAIGALSGSLHGGANERVLANAQAIGHPEAAAAFVDDLLARKEKVHGFGQRGCAGEDPRAVILRVMAAELARRKGDARIFRVLSSMHEAMAARTKLWPNVDYYSASVLHSLGLPRDLFTPLFAVSRSVGWSAHVLEQQVNNRLIRPKAKYVGPAPRRVAR